MTNRRSFIAALFSPLLLRLKRFLPETSTIPDSKVFIAGDPLNGVTLEALNDAYEAAWYGKDSPSAAYVLGEDGIHEFSGGKQILKPISFSLVNSNDSE